MPPATDQFMDERLFLFRRQQRVAPIIGRSGFEFPALPEHGFYPPIGVVVVGDLTLSRVIRELAFVVDGD